METALDLSIDFPPPIRVWLKESEKIEDAVQLTVIGRMARQGNWEGHWNKHRNEFQKQITEQQDLALKDRGLDIAVKLAEFKAERVFTVQENIGKVVKELMARMDFMDDRALVQFAKLLFDSQKDAIEMLQAEFDKQGNPEDAPGTESRRERLAKLGLLSSAVDVAQKKLPAGKETLGAESPADAQDTAIDLDAFKELENRVLPKDKTA